MNENLKGRHHHSKLAPEALLPAHSPSAPKRSARWHWER
jgi:hypothetical protein